MIKNLSAMQETCVQSLGREDSLDGNSLQYSCLEISMDIGVWQATVHGVAKRWTCWATNTYIACIFYQVVNIITFWRWKIKINKGSDEWHIISDVLSHVLWLTLEQYFSYSCVSILTSCQAILRKRPLHSSGKQF